MRVLVTGPSGYLGGAVIPALLAAGHEPRALVHRRPHGGGVEEVAGDLIGGTGLEAACDGCDAIVHLAGRLRGTPAQLEDLHVRGTRNLARAAAAAGVSGLVHVSATGARSDGTPYQRTKWRAEEAVRGAGLRHTILRPTVIFGPGGPGANFVRQLAGVLRAAPFAPIFGDGRYLLQPVCSTDIAAGCAGALGLAAADGRTYDVGGPEQLTYEEVLRRIAGALGRPFRPVHVPVPLVRAGLPLLERLPGFPIGRDELTMLLAGNTCDASTFWSDFGITPRRFEGR